MRHNIHAVARRWERARRANARRLWVPFATDRESPYYLAPERAWFNQTTKTATSAEIDQILRSAKRGK